jgi:hypothetical protein
MPNNKQYPGEEQHYGQGPQGEKVGRPKQRNFWRSATLVMTIVAILASLVAYVAIKFPRLVGNYPAQTTMTTTGATGPQTSTTVIATSTNATSQSSTPVVQPTATVPSGMITENILLSCGGCNDPIQLTITTVQVDDANGRMVWTTSLKNITGNQINYSFNEYDLLANGTQTKIPATYSPGYGGSLNDDTPFNMEETFAFVPLQNVTYTLTVIMSFNNSTESDQITFNPVPITFQ